MTECASNVRRIEKRLLDNAFAEAILEASPIGMFLADRRGQFLYVNLACERLSGLSRDDLLEGGFADLVHPEDRMRLSAEWRQACEQSENCESKGRLVRKDNSVVFVKVTATIVQSNGNSTYLGVLEDLTAQRRVHEASMNAWRLERLEEFIATLVHDLKAPLVGADRVLEMLVNRSMGDLNSRQLDAISLLKAANGHKLSMIQKLLDVYLLESGKQEFQFGPMNIRSLLTDTIIDAAKMAEQKNIRVEFECAADLPMLKGDRRAMSEVMNNLLRNALTYSPDEGLIVVKVEKAEKGVLIRVIDAGLGIPEDKQSYLFYHFVQGQSGTCYVANTGLGLYTSRLIVEAHGGTIGCRSEPGLGSVFSVMLPLEPPESEAR